MIRSAENRRSYNAEIMPSGTVVDFAVSGKDRILCLSEQGVITVVESARAVKQTGKLAEKEIFTCIKEVEDKILVTCYSKEHRSNTFRLQAPDLRDLCQHMIEDEGRLV